MSEAMTPDRVTIGLGMGHRSLARDAAAAGLVDHVDGNAKFLFQQAGQGPRHNVGAAAGRIKER